MSGISRRTVLRGAGVAMALPWLESLSAWDATCPKRFAVLFMGNGINGNHWWARGSGAEMTLSRSLAPLEPLKHEDQRDQRPVQQAGRRHGHSSRPDRQPAVRRADSEGTRSPGRASRWIRCSRTVSARRRRSASLVLACEPPATGCHETNFSMAYSSHISWQSAGSPVPNDVSSVAARSTALFDNRGQLRASEHPRSRERCAPQPAPLGQRDRQRDARRVPDQRPRGGAQRIERASAPRQRRPEDSLASTRG
jgi:hypothetical protein